MRPILFHLLKPACVHDHTHGGATRRQAVKTNFPAARRHLEEAYHLLTDEDELSHKSRQALEILIDALLAAEYSGKKPEAKVIHFPSHRAGHG